MASKTKILMVCLGNICRSPLAEGILKSKLPEDTFYVDSAGTGDWHVGQKPDARSIAVAKKYGIDISGQRGRQISPSDLEEFDLIYVMDSSNKGNVLSLSTEKNQQLKIDLILNALFQNENVDVPDPYYGTETDFEHVFKLLNESCEIIAKKLQS